MRCGSTSAPATVDEFVDCRTIAPTVTIRDPARDVANGAGQGRPDADETPASVDLRAVRVAANPRRLCVEWHMGGSIEPPFTLSFWQSPSEDPKRGLALSVASRRGGPAEIGTSAYGPVRGRFGLSGERAAVLVESKDLAPPLRAGLGRPFTFAARAGHPGYSDKLNERLSALQYP
jgi:hypothetical protein